MNRRRGVLAALLIIVLATMAACGSNGSDDQKSGKSSSSDIAIPADLKESGILRMAMNPGYPPWDEFIAGSFAGADFDLGNEVAKRLGLRPQWSQIEFGALITSLGAGRIDVILSGMSDTKERQEVVDFVDYYDTPWGFLVKKGNPKGLNTLGDLCGATASAESGTAGVGFLETQDKKCVAEGKSKINITTYSSVSQIQLALRSGRTDVDLENYDALAYSAKTAGDGKLFEAVALTELPSAPYGMGISKSNKELTAAVQKALQAMIDDGTYQKILKKNDINEGGVTQARINSATS